MTCKNCGGAAIMNEWGPWCDACGGVPLRPGELIFRHVATVYGPGGRFPIVFDATTSDYAFMHRKLNPPSNKRDIDGFRRPRVRVSHGPLDAIIAVSYPDVRGEGDDAQIRIAAAPSSTELEKRIVLNELV